jgi:hypothetical protein
VKFIESIWEMLMIVAPFVVLFVLLVLLWRAAAFIGVAIHL